MRIGDLVYFAPGLRFDEINLDGSALPQQVELRISGYYLKPAKNAAAGARLLPRAYFW